MFFLNINLELDNLRRNVGSSPQPPIEDPHRYFIIPFRCLSILTGLNMSHEFLHIGDRHVVKSHFFWQPFRARDFQIKEASNNSSKTKFFCYYIIFCRRISFLLCCDIHSDRSMRSTAFGHLSGSCTRPASCNSHSSMLFKDVAHCF